MDPYLNFDVAPKREECSVLCFDRVRFAASFLFVDFFKEKHLISG